ncbi:hypothetical protein ACA135_03660 [Methanobrevibacter acididurans]|uniref:hypothetical protein n=1 Tax=Methanobrevibacter acididurans TaxID=120963 RepID=UPI0038FC2CDE
MIVKNLDCLSIPKELKKVEIEIYEDFYIYLIQIDGFGYALHSNKGDNRSNLYVLKTDFLPSDYVLDENYDEKKQFIIIVKRLLFNLYENLKIKESKKMQEEYVFIHLMDLLETGQYEIITKDYDLYSLIEEGVIKLVIDTLKNEVNDLKTIVNNQDS